MSTQNTEALLESNTAILEEAVEPEPAPRNARSIESIWPKHKCEESEWAVGISMCACGAAFGILTVFALCNSADRNH